MKNDNSKTVVTSIGSAALVSVFFLLVIPHLMRNPGARSEILNQVQDDENQEYFIRIANVKIHVEIADNWLEQIQGLSGRDSLCDRCGMLFVYEKAQILNFWMKDMRFPLDIIFAHQGRVVDIFENVPIPTDGGAIPRVLSQQPADMVLEVNAGFVLKNNTKVEDIVEF